MKNFYLVALIASACSLYFYAYNIEQHEYSSNEQRLHYQWMVLISAIVVCISAFLLLFSVVQ